MEECWGLWLLLMVTFFLGIRGNLECIQTDKCDCYNFTDLEFKCPRNNYQVSMKTIPGKNIKIVCETYSESNLGMLPNIPLGDLDNFVMRYCQLPTYGFNETLNKFNISRIKSMKLEGINSSKSSISKQLFYGLENMEHLDLKSFEIKFEEDFLEYLPNLTTLDLESNKIREITVKIFKDLSSLRTLYLSWNFISHLPDGVFQQLSNLTYLHLTHNCLTTLKRTSFLGLNNLKTLDLMENQITSLDEDIFAELIELTKLNLAENNLQIIRTNIFKHNLNLSEVIIDNSNLESLPDHIFQGCVKLSKISLKNNKITRLPQAVFKNLKNLKRLYLNGNKIKILSTEMFSSLQSLQDLDLRGNQLKEMNWNVCRKCINLVKLNLSYNNISDINKEITSPYNTSYNYCESLQNLDLSHNAIKVFPSDFMRGKSHLKYLDLSYNHINKIKMASLLTSPYFVKVSVKNNNVSVLDFEEIKRQIQANKLFSNKTRVILSLLNNPIKCDCDNFDLIQYYNNEMDPVLKSLVDIKVGNLHCTIPQLPNAKIPFILLKPNYISCPLLGTGCPKECECAYWPSDKHALVNCSNRNLTNSPFISLQYDKVVVKLEGNFIETAPYKGLGYDNVTRMYLSDNNIGRISWIPPKIEVLTLSRNQLKFLDPKVLHALNQSTSLKKLELHGNPWSCSCANRAFQNFLEIHYKKVKSDDVKCADTKKSLIDQRDLCKSKLAIAMTIVIPILVVLLSATTVIALYFYYKNEIKIWLYAKNLCLWYVIEEELDTDKTYDVFISHSHKDEEFVIQNLLPILEQGPDPYKVCINNRDSIPGEFIARQVTNSVLDSRRTLVVLSESFLESVWGRMEFRTAHTQAISERRARVIVLKYGNLDEENLDNELKAYLKTNTYVEWGDPWLWYKLKYALPHSKQNRFFDKNANKHANIMLNIDKKFESGKCSMKPFPEDKAIT